MPKTVGTRRHCEEDGEHATIFRNPLPTSRFLGVAEDCCMLSILLAVPSCTYSFWHGVIPTSYFIFNDFYTCSIYEQHVQCSVHFVQCTCVSFNQNGSVFSMYTVSSTSAKIIKNEVDYRDDIVPKTIDTKKALP